MLLLERVLVTLWVITVATCVAPGDEADICATFRSLGISPIPNYAANMVILMDSDNYPNLLPPRTGAVWQQVDNDVNNDPTISTNVSCYYTILYIAIQPDWT